MLWGEPGRRWVWGWGVVWVCGFPQTVKAGLSRFLADFEEGVLRAALSSAELGRFEISRKLI